MDWTLHLAILIAGMIGLLILMGAVDRPRRSGTLHERLFRHSDAGDLD